MYRGSASNVEAPIGIDHADKMFSILQIASGSFPIGSFTQSWGLETFVAEKVIFDVATFKFFLDTFLESVVCNSEAPIVLEAHKNILDWDEEAIEKLNEISLAMKLTKESRLAATKGGKAMMRVGKEIVEDIRIEELYNKCRKSNITLPVAFGIISGILGISKENTAKAYFYTALSTLVQSGIKLIPLGNIEAQKLLSSMNAKLEEYTQKSLNMKIEEINNFSPMLDIAGMNHEDLASRLYMS